MKPYLLTALLWLALTAANAQRTCLTDEYVKTHFQLQNKDTDLSYTVPPRDTFPNEIITIPVIVHVLFNSSTQNISVEQILSQIDALNKDFRLLNSDKSMVPGVFAGLQADSRIMFCLAKVAPDGRSTSGINRVYTNKPHFMAADDMKFKSKGGVDAWDTKNYLNIWVCNMFGRALGYATPPGGDPTKDGVVINFDVFGTKGVLRTDFNKGRTATHEISHWMGLHHIWGDDLCGDDSVDDTPRQKSYNFGCPSFPRVSNCSLDGNGDMYMNFLDLTNDACMYMFTQGQKMKMRTEFSLKGKRNSFLRSHKCDGSLATGGPMPQDSLPVAAPILPADIIQVFPNPVINRVNIQSKELITLKGKTAVVYTLQGKPVHSVVLQSNIVQINIGHLPPGMYMLRIGDAEASTHFKMIKM